MLKGQIEMRYHNITKDDMLNGDGLRVVLWVAGCSHCCKDCHNPVTWDPNGGLHFGRKAKQEIFDELEKSYVSGLTLSGGDPLYPGNRLDVEGLVREVKEKFPDKTIWLYTGGLWEKENKYPLVKYLDVMVDGEYERDRRNTQLYWRGSANQRVIDVQKSLAKGEEVLYCD